MRKLTTEELRQSKMTRMAYASQPKNKVILLIDGIQSSHIIGAFVRLADAFLIEKVIICNAPNLNPKKLTKTSIGTQKWVEIQQEVNAVDVTKKLKSKGYFIASIELCKTSINYLTANYSQQPTVLVLGSEKYGVSEELIQLSDMLIHIQMFGMGNSMNVSSAGAIVLADLISKATWLK